MPTGERPGRDVVQRDDSVSVVEEGVLYGAHGDV